MPVRLPHSQLESRTQRAKLIARRKPYSLRIAPGIRVGYRRNSDSAGTWSVICADGAGGSWMKRIALADDHEDADGKTIMDFWQACDAARQLAKGEIRNGTGLAEMIACKMRSFADKGVEPACYLYRHYDPNGDLLYAGISLDALRRQAKHMAGEWRHLITQILITMGDPPALPGRQQKFDSSGSHAPGSHRRDFKPGPPSTRTKFRRWTP
jgi:hypothetical protein